MATESSVDNNHNYRVRKFPISITRVGLARGLYIGVMLACSLTAIVAGLAGTAGEQALSVSRALIKTDPVGALQWNMRAYSRNPWAYQPRLNMILSLQAVLNLPDKNPQITVKLSERVADLVYELSSSASPHHAYVLLLRFNYLLRTGKDASEIVEELKNHTHRPEVREALKVWKDIQ